MRHSNYLEKQIPTDTYWRDDQMDMKVEARNSLKLPLEYN